MSDETGCLLSVVIAIVVAMSIPVEYTKESFVVLFVLGVVAWIYKNIIKTKEETT